MFIFSRVLKQIQVVFAARDVADFVETQWPHDFLDEKSLTLWEICRAKMLIQSHVFVRSLKFHCYS